MRRFLVSCLLPLFLGCTPDGSLTGNDRSVRLVPLFRANTSVSSVALLRTALVRPGRDSTVKTLAYQSGSWISLGTVESGDSFTVSLTGLDTSSGKTLARWWITGSGRAGTTAEQTVALSAPDSAPSTSSLALPAQLHPGTLVSLPAGSWSWTLDGSDPRSAASALPARDSLRLTSTGMLCLARIDSGAGRPGLWSDRICQEIVPLPDGDWMQDKGGKLYPTVTLGSQTWMARNLDWQSPDSSRCLFDSLSSCATYGRLYAWSQAMTACPSGWHLPSKADWITLLDTYTLAQLKGSSGWSSGHNGSNSTGFGMLPGGEFFSGSWDQSTIPPSTASFWTATQSGTSNAVSISILAGSDTPTITDFAKFNGFSVRCLKD